ncbi:MAG: protoporphyrinogen oxidase HemJ [Pseudomonadota bacterium]
MFWDTLSVAYPYTKTLHIVSFIAWMAGLFYLPRLFVYHAERASAGDQLDETLKVMEHKLLKVIINPAGVATWIFGTALVLTPGVVDWRYDGWAYVKAAAVIGMTVYHHALVRWTRSFAQNANQRAGGYYRAMNEVPTVLLLVIVAMVIVRTF